MADKALSGGDKLEAKLKELAVGLAKGAKLQVGFLEGATYPDGTSVPMVAAIQEFGAPAAGIPPRSFFRTTIAEHSDEWGDTLGKAIVHHDYDAYWALNDVGFTIKSEVQQSISELMEPELSPVTLMLRKMQYAPEKRVITSYKDVQEARERVAKGESVAGVPTKPLVWTGHMLSSVDFFIEE